jgi:hypothetical protein
MHVENPTWHPVTELAFICTAWKNDGTTQLHSYTVRPSGNTSLHAHNTEHQTAILDKCFLAILYQFKHISLHGCAYAYSYGEGDMNTDISFPESNAVLLQTL